MTGGTAAARGSCPMLYAARFAAWSPGIDTGAAWREWAAGKGRLVSSDESPAVPFLDAGLRRRLSQISKMTLKVLHGLLPLREGARLAFVSLRGEIQQQFSMNRKLALEGEVSPAAFSHSVFNNPVAMAALAFSLDAGYTAMYPSLANFGAAFVAAAASLCSGEQDEIAFIYADEHCPPPYPVPDHPYTLAFGMVLHTSGGGVPVLADAAAHNPGGCLHSPAALLRHLYQFPAETGEPA